MGKKLAIQGHPTRGKEIIELLEMMGGINKNMLSAHIGDVLNPHVYFLEPDSSDNRIVWNYLLGLEWDGRASDMMIFTLEEFLEKFPYKLNDLVLCDDGLLGVVTKMEWDSEKSDMKYHISFNISDYNKWYSSKNIKCKFMAAKGKKLAIKGHSTRGKEVIELLEMLGGKNTYGLDGEMESLYFFDPDSSDNRIVWDYFLSLEHDDRVSEMMIFTLEEFLEKYPFKVGDKVYIKVDPNENCLGSEKLYGVIESAKWIEKFGYVVYKLKYYDGIVYREELYPYKEDVSMEDNKLFGTLSNPVETKSYAVGLKDGKVIECGVNKETDMNKIKPLFKYGDVIKLKGCPDKNLFWIVVDVVEDGYIFNDGEKCSFDDQHHYEKTNREVINTSDITAKVADKNHKMGPKSKLPLKYYEDKLEEIQSKRECDELRMPLNDNENNFPLFEPMFKVNDELEYKIPDGYEITEVSKDTVFIKPIKSKYPTTYAECCDVLNIPNDERYIDIDVPLDYNKLVSTFTELLICRKAYWKIAGEEMGLGKPWEPDWTNLDQLKCCIWVDVGEFITMINVRGQHILAFPTEEMRDVFHENFKKEIEQCKELL